MKKFLSLTLLAMIFSIASFASPLPPIGGPTSLCLGDTVTLYDTSSTGGGGTWSSSNTAVCIIGLTSGDIYGVAPGTSTITWYSGGSSVSMTFTVNPAPPPAITGGATSFCTGTTSQLSDAVPGGTWSSSSPYIATVNPATGLVTGVSGGTATIYYSTGGVCSAFINVTINATTIGPIYGPTSVCAAGGTISITDTALIGTGTWSSSNPGIATIGVTSGTVTGIAVGTTTITYTTSGTCGTGYVTQVINVINTTDPGVISGSSSFNVGSTNILYETVTGGTWSCSNTSIATIDASGTVTGVATGSAAITYTVSGCGGLADTTFAISVTPFDGISGYVNFPGASYYGWVTIWLITYNPLTMDLEAIDSESNFSYASGGVFYQFLGIATDSYRVKAAIPDSVGVTTTGYLPTYHTSSYYWYSADVINHTSGTADINEDINMAYGTFTTGPGFIGGNVTTGANRGTSVGIPVAGLNMIVVNSTTNQVVQSTTTNASGSYSFNNLPLGTYYVFPDSLNYRTTAYTSITLAAGATTISAADFIQHTISKTITPVNESVSNVGNIVSSVIAFPNPTNGKLNLQWTETSTEKGNVYITDVTGREIYKTAINMNEGTGVKQLDLSGLVNGLYVISVKSGTINYNTKIQIQH